MRTIAAAVLGVLVLTVVIVSVVRDRAPDRAITSPVKGPAARDSVARDIELPRSTKESGRRNGAAASVPAADPAASVPRDAGDGVGFVGRVESIDGRPVVGATVAVTLAAGGRSGEPRNFSRGLTTRRSATTDADGRFSFARLPTASGRLDISASGYRTRQEPLVIPPTGSQGAVFTLTPALQIRGRVVDRGGHPVPRAIVNATGEASSRSSGGAVAGADGAFVVDGLRAGAHRLTARARGFVLFTRKHVPAGGDPVEIILTRMGSVSGRVSARGTGAPVKSFRINFARVTTTGDAHWSRDAVGRPDGRYRVELGEGVYVGTLEADEIPTTRIERIRVTAGEETTGIDFSIGRGGEVLGDATAAGAFTPTGTIRAVRIQGDGRVDARCRARTAAIGEAGRFHVRALAPGTWRLILSSTSCYSDPIPLITIAEGQVLRLAVVVRRGGSLTVRVMTPSGEQPASGTWRVTDARGRLWSGDFAAEPRLALGLPVALRGKGGFAIVGAIAAGSASIEIDAPPFAPVRRKVKIADGAAATLDVRLR